MGRRPPLGRDEKARVREKMPITTKRMMYRKEKSRSDRRKNPPKKKKRKPSASRVGEKASLKKQRGRR